MAPAPDAGVELGYSPADLQRLAQLSQGLSLTGPESLCDFIDRLAYLEDWRSEYRVQSVRSALYAPAVTCLDSAVLSYGLLELLFPATPRRLLAIHRRDPATDEECGHCVALYWTAEGKVGAVSKSSYPGLGHRPAVHADEAEVARSYAQAYLAMRFTPLYFGCTTLEAAAPDVDWRCSAEPINEISSRLQASYAYAFDTE